MIDFTHTFIRIWYISWGIVHVPDAGYRLDIRCHVAICETSVVYMK